MRIYDVMICVVDKLCVLILQHFGFGAGFCCKKWYIYSMTWEKL
jgi:hypothetical protein